MISFLLPFHSHLSIQSKSRSRVPQVFLKVSPACPSVHRALFMLLLFSQLGVSPFSLARPTKCSGHSFPPHPNTVSFVLPFPSSYNSVYQVGRGKVFPPAFGFSLVFLRSLFTHSGLGEDGLGLGFLGRHHWALLTIPTKSELVNIHRNQHWKGSSLSP